MSETRHPQSVLRAELLRDLERSDLTIGELVERATEVLAQVAPRQSRHKVSERPDVRTIRYYTARRILPPPVSYDGGRARYSGAHLARLALLKKMQAEHHTLRVISRTLGDASDAEIVEALVGAGASEAPSIDPAALGQVNVAPSANLAESTTIDRHALPGGANLDIPSAALGDPTVRVALADALDALAGQLRASPKPGSDEHASNSRRTPR